MALEENADEDDSGDLVVWYCLGDKDNKTGNGYYAHSPKMMSEIIIISIAIKI
ncbi:hypothetical protein WKT11_02820 [Blautia sp. HCN-1074]